MTADKKALLEKLKQKCKDCQACALADGRTNIVFADGNPNSAKVILIGEAPGENEDLQGIPFVGRAGKLLNQFISDSGLSRENDFYIINTVKCRPPKNRVPSREEKAECREYMIEQIEIIDPQVILLCGATALSSFVKEKTPISKIRGEVFDVEINKKNYKVMPIFHPSYLLRHHSSQENSPRALMASDLKAIFDLINK